MRNGSGKRFVPCSERRCGSVTTALRFHSPFLMTLRRSIPSSSSSGLANASTCCGRSLLFVVTRPLLPRTLRGGVRRHAGQFPTPHSLAVRDVQVLQYYRCSTTLPAEVRAGEGRKEVICAVVTRYIFLTRLACLTPSFMCKVPLLKYMIYVIGFDALSSNTCPSSCARVRFPLLTHQKRRLASSQLMPWAHIPSAIVLMTPIPALPLPHTTAGDDGTVVAVAESHCR